MRLEPPPWWYGSRIPAAAWGLLPFSWIYGVLAARRFRKTQPYRSKLPVICVGNFTVGGAGKTPVALKLASLLRDQGRKPGFLTRGYGGTERGPHLAGTALDSPERIGDEPQLLAEAAPTVVSRNRPLGARLLETLGVDTIIMDDGFQNPSLAKDFSLIVADADAGIGSGHVFPLGPLRARLGFQARMANAVIIVGGEARRRSSAKILEQLNSSLEKGEGWGEAAFFAPGRNVFEAKIVPAVSDEMRAKPFLAFCGIGRPAKFFDTLRGAGVSLAECRAFPDHHPFTEDDARILLAEAKALNAGLITTGKDMARLKGASGAAAELRRIALALPITIEFLNDGEEALLNAITCAFAANDWRLRRCEQGKAIQD